MNKKLTRIALLIAAVWGLGWLGYHLWFQSYNIGAASMAPTLIQGDAILALKNRSADKFERGDLVLFRQADPANEIYVKRIIAIAGDVVEYDGQNFSLNGSALVHIRQADQCSKSELPRWVQGAAYMEINHQRRYEICIASVNDGPKGSITVPPQHYFVLGDNRNQSRDSRFIGPVPTSAVIGKPVVIWWSSIDVPKPTIRWERIGRLLP